LKLQWIEKFHFHLHLYQYHLHHFLRLPTIVLFHRWRIAGAPLLCETISLRDDVQTYNEMTMRVDSRSPTAPHLSPLHLDRRILSEQRERVPSPKVVPPQLANPTPTFQPRKSTRTSTSLSTFDASATKVDPWTECRNVETP
jgi:hypothetical protein